MIEALANKLATNIKIKVPDHPASVNVLKFALAALLNGAFIVVFSLIISLIIGTLPATILVLISFAVLRQMSGGIHLKSGIACVLTSITGVILLSLADINKNAIFVVNIVNIILALTFSPSGIEKQTRIKPKYFPLLKISSTLLVAVNIYINSPVLAATFFVQCLTLIRNPVRGRRGKI
ncbi:accessory gene regulator B family protein [Paenibacillus solisilvae]|uniref:Accessory gene regulator B family protein n=1 Tax=Paenibacillus solisilvae TaxID=2486751 RepID=A0ABW0VVF9_9BACL